jgi:type VI secretion system secreted protein VgrG
MTDETTPIQFTFEAGEFGPTDLLVTSFRGTEGVSELFRFEIELASEDADLDFEAVAGQSGKLILRESDGDRYVHGIVSGIEAIGFGRRFARYRATLVPAVWPLTLIRRSRIYEQVAVPEIIRRVLEADSVPSDRFRITAAVDHPVREYCVQYRESDWDFISRLMEDEGLIYFFEQGEDGAVLVIDDRPDVRPPIEGDATILFRDPGMGVAAQGQIWRFMARRVVRPTKVQLREYDFQHPSRNPDEQSDGDVEPAFDKSALCDYDYPGGLVESSVGGPLPTFRLEALRSGDLTMSGESNLPRLRPAHRFTLDGHHRDGFNIEYQVVRVAHDGSQEQVAQEEAAEEGHTVYHNSLECIPGDAHWRAPRRTRAPRIPGPQTARVVGPAGEEIHTDEHGRIRVEFHWSRHDGYGDDSSCWIRVSQAWAGPGWGALFIPRIGHEVVVQFLEGDPDRPLVTGSVYNGANPPPYALPGEKTKSTIKSDSSLGGGGFNELRFEDAKGAEEIFLHAEKDWNTVVLHDNTETVGHDQTRKVDHDQTLNVGHDRSRKVGNNETVEITANRTKTIGGNETIEVRGERQTHIRQFDFLWVDQGQLVEVLDNQSIQVQGAQVNMVRCDQMNAVDGGATETIGKDWIQKITRNSNTDVGGDAGLNISGDQTETVSGTANRDVTGGETVHVGKKYKLDAGDQVTVVCGSAQLIMKKNGDIDIKGKNIKIEASGNLTLKGAKIAGN